MKFFSFNIVLGILIRSYQRFISPFLPNSCRYYPTCSEYAVWTMYFNNPIDTFIKIIFRILKCNQFFKGGIDYPKGKKILKPNFMPPQRILFWLVPLEKHYQSRVKFYIIKSL